jgi:cytochrome b
MAEGVPTRRVRIWDLPTRIFHWLLVLLIPFQWWTAEEEMLELHILGGTTILALLTFRIVWGLIGSSTARFANFVKGPRGVISYLSGRAVQVLGHNPLGGLSVMAMLGLLSLQVTLGLFAGDDDGIDSGPLAHLIDGDLSEDIADLHEDLFDVLLVLIGFHIAAILFYALVQRKNLVGPMITGSGNAPDGTTGMETAGIGRFLAAALIAAAFVFFVRSLG